MFHWSSYSDSDELYVYISASPLSVFLNIPEDKSTEDSTNEKREQEIPDQSEGAVGGVMETIAAPSVTEEEEYVVKVFGKNDPRPPPEDSDVGQGQSQGHSVDLGQGQNWGHGQPVDVSQVEVEIERPQTREAGALASQRRHSKSKKKVSIGYV